jgi:hypothetical protein
MTASGRHGLPLVAATALVLLAGCATATRPASSIQVQGSEPATPNLSSGADPEATPTWGFADVDAPVPAADFVRSGEAYFLILEDEWVRIWVGAPAARPDRGRVLVIRAPIVNGVPDATRDRETLMDLPLQGTPFIIVGALDTGVLAIQSGDGTGKRVGFDLHTLAFVPVEIAPIRIDCGPLPATDCRAVMEAIAEVADNVNADIQPTTCHGTACASGPPSAFSVGVVLRSGEGEATEVLTCVRPTPSDPVHCG